ncbi:cadherin-like domain-containing protein [Dokdonella sp.]|uniref:cadherin-like domain-containing protein n=1 Tax=Dokdonella sp. TaxID=2291710 RepID=UPI00378497F0
MRRRLVLLFAVACCAVASAQILPQDPNDDGVPSVTDPSVPLSYVGNDGSVSIGVNREGQTEGQLLGVFARNNARALVGQIWWDRAGAGGAQADFNWLWGGDPIAAREHPDRATVSRLSFALDQNAQHDRKATLGFGVERRDYSIEAWLAHGVSGARAAGHALHDDLAQLGGSDDIGAYTQVETTTTDTLFESKAYGTEIGVQFGHVFEPMAMRVHGGASTADGDGARATTFSLGLDTPLGTRGWGLSALAEHVARSGGAGSGSDDRLSVFLRYEFGRSSSFAPTAQLQDPAWITRSLARPSSAHPRTVESYRRTRSQTVSVTRGPRQYTNHFPIAQADGASTPPGVAVTINVVANDTDADGDALSVSAVTPPAHGSAVASGGNIVYTPVAGFSGADAFAYTVSDGRGGSASANVAVSVGGGPSNQPPVARDDSAATSFGQTVRINVLANDGDPDGDPLVIASVGAPAHGTASISGQSILYVPTPGYIGPDLFTYTIEDGQGGSATATVTITVAAQPNRNPVARPDAATVTTGQIVTIDVLANDNDVDGDALTVIALGAPQHGAVAIFGNQVQYASVAGYAGPDSFTYTISDGRGGNASATVTINVVPLPNRPPVAVNDNASTTFAASVAIAVLANDSDPDGDPLTITATTPPTFGTIVVAGGSITYTANAAGTVGVDTFTYTISDGRGGTATATVSVTVTAVTNQPPTAVDDNATTPFGQPVTIAVLANDSDPDGDPLVIASVTPASNGTATIAGNAIVYTPGPGFNGLDRFAYTISDGRGGVATAFVTVVVSPAPNQPPVAVADTGGLNQTVIPVLANDSDPDGDPLTIIGVTMPVDPNGAPAGTVAITGNTVTWIPPAGFLNSATFTYTISDGRGGTATAIVNVVTGIP